MSSKLLTDEEQKIKDAYPVGRCFHYLGVKMSVLRHQPPMSDLRMGFNYFPPSPAQILCRYVDNHGKFNQIWLSYAEVEATAA